MNDSLVRNLCRPVHGGDLVENYWDLFGRLPRGLACCAGESLPLEVSRTLMLGLVRLTAFVASSPSHVKREGQSSMVRGNSSGST